MNAAVTSSSTDCPIPILHIAAFLNHEPGALESLSAKLRDALENVGFYYIRGHGVSQSLIDRVFAECAQFHAQPLDESPLFVDPAPRHQSQRPSRSVCDSVFL